MHVNDSFWITRRNFAIRASIMAEDVNPTESYTYTTRLCESIAKLADLIADRGLSTRYTLSRYLDAKGYKMEAVMVPFASQLDRRGLNHAQLELLLEHALKITANTELPPLTLAVVEDLIPKHELFVVNVA